MSDRDRARDEIEQVITALNRLHRYTITSEGASSGYFRLVEDAAGCWLQWPEIESILQKLEAVLRRSRAVPPHEKWAGETDRATGARVRELDADGNIRLEDEIGEFYVWREGEPAESRAVLPEPPREFTKRDLMQMFSDGIDVARSYGGNAFHLWGDQLRSQFDRAYQRLLNGEGQNVQPTSALSPDTDTAPSQETK